MKSKIVIFSIILVVSLITNISGSESYVYIEVDLPQHYSRTCTSCRDSHPNCEEEYDEAQSRFRGTDRWWDENIAPFPFELTDELFELSCGTQDVTSSRRRRNIHPASSPVSMSRTKRDSSDSSSDLSSSDDDDVDTEAGALDQDASARSHQNRLIYINDAKFGQVNPGYSCDDVEDDGTCLRSVFADNTYDFPEYHRPFSSCNGQTACIDAAVPRYFLSNYDRCNHDSDFIQIEYQCIEERLNFNIFDSPQFSSSYGYLMSPNYPDEYRHDQSIICHLGFNAYTRGSFLLTLMDFNLEGPGDDNPHVYQNNCIWDYVEIHEIRDGDISYIQRVCGHWEPGSQYEAYADELKLIFRADSAIAATGFWVKYQGIGEIGEDLNVELNCDHRELPCDTAYYFDDISGAYECADNLDYGNGIYDAYWYGDYTEEYYSWTYWADWSYWAHWDESSPSTWRPATRTRHSFPTTTTSTTTTRRPRTTTTTETTSTTTTRRPRRTTTTGITAISIRTSTTPTTITSPITPSGTTTTATASTTRMRLTTTHSWYDDYEVTDMPDSGEEDPYISEEENGGDGQEEDEPIDGDESIGDGSEETDDPDQQALESEDDGLDTNTIIISVAAAVGVIVVLGAILITVVICCHRRQGGVPKSPSGLESHVQGKPKEDPSNNAKRKSENPYASSVYVSTMNPQSLDNPNYKQFNSSSSNLPRRTDPLPPAPQDQEEIYQDIVDDNYEPLTKCSTNSINNLGTDNSAYVDGLSVTKSTPTNKPSKVYVNMPDYSEPYLDMNSSNVSKNRPESQKPDAEPYEAMTNAVSSPTQSEHYYLSVTGETDSNDYLKPLK